MSRFKIIPVLLLATMMCGCSKIDPAVDVDGGDTSAPITLGTTESWTKGVSIESLAGVEELTLYSFDAYDAGSWAELTDSDDLDPFFTTGTTTPLTLTTDDKGATWDYTGTTGGLRYWRADDKEAVTFFALYPASELTTTFDETSGKPIFSYTMSTLANENDDLVIDALFDLNNKAADGSTVNFDLQHALTKLTLKVALSGEIPDGEALGVFGTTEYFVVNGISFTGLYDGATLDVDLNEDGSTRSLRWTLDADKVTDTDASTIELTAAQGNTIVPIYTTDDSGDVIINPSAILSNDPLMVMEAGEAIFALPQLLETRDTPPTAKVRIRRLYYTDEDDTDGLPSGELLYSSEAIVIPSATKDVTGEGEGWLQGQHNELSFTFDLSNISEYDTPLTLTSQIYDWTEVDVNTTVHANTYIYSSDSDIELTSTETTADMYIYTNYAYDLRRHKRNIELDGSSTEAAGFTFYTTLGGPYEPLVVIDGDDGEKDYYYVYDDNGDLYLSTTEDSVSTDAIKVDIDSDGVADLSGYETTTTDEDIDGDGVNETVSWMTFKIKPYDTTDMTDEELAAAAEAYDFTYKVARLTRDDLGLYTNSTVETTSYGVNKSEKDAVYILRLDVNKEHLKDEYGSTLGADATYGYFSGSIGAELLSNGGGKITYKFGVSLKKAL